MAAPPTISQAAQPFLLSRFSAASQPFLSRFSAVSQPLRACGDPRRRNTDPTAFPLQKPPPKYMPTECVYCFV
jgi:hypothetical protein